LLASRFMSFQIKADLFRSAPRAAAIIRALAALRRGGSRRRWGCGQGGARRKSVRSCSGRGHGHGCGTQAKRQESHPVQALAGEGMAGAALQPTSPPTHDWLWVSELMVVAKEVGRAGDQLGVRVGSM